MDRYEKSLPRAEREKMREDGLAFSQVLREAVEAKRQGGLGFAGLESEASENPGDRDTDPDEAA
jgi:hypothetical protein